MRARARAIEPLGWRKKKYRSIEKNKYRSNAGVGESDRALGLKVKLGVEVVQEARVRAHEVTRLELQGKKKKKRKKRKKNQRDYVYTCI